MKMRMAGSGKKVGMVEKNAVEARSTAPKRSKSVFSEGSGPQHCHGRGKKKQSSSY
jgi:hypothetical protein